MPYQAYSHNGRSSSLKLLAYLIAVTLQGHIVFAALPDGLNHLIAPIREQCLSSLLRQRPAPFVGLADCIANSDQLSNDKRRLVLNNRVVIDSHLATMAIGARCADKKESDYVGYLECRQLLGDQEPDLAPYRDRIAQGVTAMLRNELRRAYEYEIRGVCLQRDLLQISHKFASEWTSGITHAGLRDQIMETVRTLYQSRRPQYLTDDEVHEFMNRQYKVMFKRYKTESQSLPAIRSPRDAEKRQQTFKEFVKNAAMADARMSRCPKKVAYEALHHSENWIKYRKPRTFTTSTRSTANRVRAELLPEDLHESSVWNKLYSSVYTQGWRSQLNELYVRGDSSFVKQFAEELINAALRTVNDNDFPDIMTRIERWRTKAYSKLEAVRSITGRSWRIKIIHGAIGITAYTTKAS